MLQSPKGGNKERTNKWQVVVIALSVCVANIFPKYANIDKNAYKTIESNMSTYKITHWQLLSNVREHVLKWGEIA